MTISNCNEATRMREAWEEEVFAGHRWGRLSLWFKLDDNRATEEHARLKKLWEAAQPLDESSEAVLNHILALEICNWNLEESILALCSAIGANEPAEQGIGHMASITEDRWKKVWAYYLTLRNWLRSEEISGYEALLRICDADKAIQNNISGMLKDRNELKELYVERFCLCLERWLSGYPPGESAQMKAHDAAVSAIEKEIKKLDPEGRILNAFQLDGDGKLLPCHHKAFRRYDVIISSIGAGKWRAVIPRRGTDGFERAMILEEYLSPIELWIHGQSKEREDKENELFDRIHSYLGEPDDVKLFLTSLLVSLLRSQQLAARKLAANRTKEA